MATITPTQGSLGVKSNKDTLLTYSLSGTMATITEKVNGVTIRTRTTPVSGQSYTVSLTQAQWDAVKFGKYANNTAGKNTLTIEMGTETFTYTFNKQPDENTDLITVAKSTQDYANTTVPAIKKQLVDKVGGNVADTFEAIIGGAAMGRKVASGSATSSSGTLSFNYASSGSATKKYVQVTGLSFNPTTVFIFGTTSNVFSILSPIAYPNTSGSTIMTGSYASSSTVTSTNNNFQLSGNASNQNGFLLPIEIANMVCNWIAIE